MSLPRVTIVIPVYNGERYVRQAIASVLAQTYENIECIVVDDGSTDGTAPVLEEYKDSIKSIRQQNGGQSKALNVGWSESEGSLLGYLSADDILHPNAVAELVSLAETEDEGIFFGRYEYIDENGQVFGRPRQKFSSFGEMLKKFYCPIGVGILFSRSLFERLGGWSSAYRQMPDLECWFRYGSNGRLLHTEKILGQFRVHGGSQTYQPSRPTAADEPVAIAQSIRLAGELAGHSARFASSAYMLSGCLHLRSGRPGTAMGRFATALRIRPLNALDLFQIRRTLGSVRGLVQFLMDAGLKKV